jgi:rod shape-determining protein MreC
MADPFRRSSQWSQYGLVLLFSIALMIVDARTNWLDGPRNMLSIAVTPVQLLASLPSQVKAWVSGQLAAEPPIKIAYENLRNEYFQLKAEALLLRALQEENQALRELLDASERLQEKITLAELVNVKIDRDNHTILVGKGLRHGIYGGQAVIDDRGVIGQVIDVMPFNSSVMLITDPGHAMPVQVQRTGLRTLVYGTGSVSLLRVPFLNQNSDIREGDVLVSSGLGGRFPNGYPVAEVTSVKIIEDESFMEITASPIAKLDRSNHVLLLARELEAEGEQTQEPITTEQQP